MEVSMQETPANVDTKDFDRLFKMVEKAKVAMLTTLDGEGRLRSRPLHTLEVSKAGVISFVISTRSPKSHEIIDHGGKLSLSYSNHADSEYVSITGTGSMVHDTVRKAAAWSKFIEIWFPGGKTDPAVVILEVTPEKAEFWDGPSNFLSQIYAYAKAAGTGNTEAFGTHAKLDLQ